MTPDELEGLPAEAVTNRLFGEGSARWWRLERNDHKHLLWHDERLGFQRSMTHGELVAFSEVSTPSQAEVHTKRNKIERLPEGGLFFKGQSVAELYLRCQGLYPPDELNSAKSLYQITIPASFTASVGYASEWFQRLVLRPAGEENPALPDPTTITTLTLGDTTLSEISGRAELAIYHLRRNFPQVRFSFWPLHKLALAPGWGDEVNPTPPRHIKDLAGTTRYDAIAFYNRAIESDPIIGFLYFYRVLESCFDDVLSDEVQRWRQDTALQAQDLLGKFRHIQSEREDRWALQRVLSAPVVEKPLLDDLAHQGLLSKADAKELCAAIYQRRNSIAHGRPGKQYSRVMVPYGFPDGLHGSHDRSFYKLLHQLADAALQRWILK